MELLPPELLAFELLDEEPASEEEDRPLELLDSEDLRLFLPG